MAYAECIRGKNKDGNFVPNRPALQINPRTIDDPTVAQTFLREIVCSTCPGVEKCDIAHVIDEARIVVRRALPKDEEQTN